MKKTIKSVLFSVYHKNGLEDILQLFKEKDIKIYATGGTAKYISSFGLVVNSVEQLTNYPSILGGRVKTLHPKVFGGILAKRDIAHLAELVDYEIPAIDLVVVDLYPFEETVQNTDKESEIIEKIDIGGISLIRAAAKNFDDILVIPSRNEYKQLLEVIDKAEVYSDLGLRKKMAARAFSISSKYDTLIFNYLNSTNKNNVSLPDLSAMESIPLRYGENPHQEGKYFAGNPPPFEQLSGKPLSYNNLVDIDAAVALLSEFDTETPCFAVLKHTNACGIATASTGLEAWKKALQGDPISAFGGVLIFNGAITLDIAKEIHKIFYEVLIATDFDSAALALLKKKKKRILLKMESFAQSESKIKNVLNGYVWQNTDLDNGDDTQWKKVTKLSPSATEKKDLHFANLCAKHLKSNTIAIVKNQQLIGMGCGQTSRVDACKQAIDKALRMGFDLRGACLASDAFFPFPDCVQLANEAGIQSIIQPGGSIKDQLSIDACDEAGMSMVFTGIRHFKH